jgi:hypothetical protein
MERKRGVVIVDDDGWHQKFSCNRPWFGFGSSIRFPHFPALFTALDTRNTCILRVHAKENEKQKHHRCFSNSSIIIKRKKTEKQTAAALVATAPTSSSPSAGGGFKVALLGAGGGIGQPLGLLLKLWVLGVLLGKNREREKKTPLSPLLPLLISKL